MRSPSVSTSTPIGTDLKRRPAAPCGLCLAATSSRKARRAPSIRSSRAIPRAAGRCCSSTAPSRSGSSNCRNRRAILRRPSCAPVARLEWGFRFRWQPHSIAMRDSCCTRRFVASDWLLSVRSGYRVQIDNVARPLRRNAEADRSLSGRYRKFRRKSSRASGLPAAGVGTKREQGADRIIDSAYDEAGPG